MNDEEQPTRHTSLLSDTLITLIRQLEPEADPEKVRSLLDELREAERELGRVSVEGVALSVGFSARWPEDATP